MDDEEDEAILLQEEKKPSTSEKRVEYESILWNVCTFILVTEFCERLAYYGLTGSLPIFFRKVFQIEAVLATELNSLFSSLTYITPLIGAWVADTHWGRFKTILIFSIWYLAGLFICSFAALPDVASFPLFIFGLFVGVSLGTGGIKPNVVVLGADQFDLAISSQRAEKDSFFNWFYWSINMGATFSFGILTNIAVSGLPPVIPQDYGFFASFMIPALVFVIGFFVFRCGKSRYRRVPPKGSTLSVFFRVVIQAAASSRQGWLFISSGMLFLPGMIFTTVSYFIQDSYWHLLFALTGAILVLCGALFIVLFGRSTDWLHSALVEGGGTFKEDEVMDAMQVLRLAPYFSFMVMFWAIYAQQNNNFVLQGCQMDLRIGDSDKQVSAAMLSVLDSSIILVFIPIFEKFLYPYLRSRGVEPTPLRKIGAGFTLCIFAMIVAGAVESLRKSSSLVHHLHSNCASENEELSMSQLSIWWQAPQYTLIGLSEILASISAYDLFYTEVPNSMKSVLGFMVAGGMNSVFSFWITHD